MRRSEVTKQNSVASTGLAGSWSCWLLLIAHCSPGGPCGAEVCGADGAGADGDHRRALACAARSSAAAGVAAALAGAARRGRDDRPPLVDLLPLLLAAALRAGRRDPEGRRGLQLVLLSARGFAANQIQYGHFPLWNPYLYTGAPFAADYQAGALYPLNLLVWVIARPFTYGAFEALIIFHVWWASVTAYAFRAGDRVAARGGTRSPGSSSRTAAS